MNYIELLKGMDFVPIGENFNYEPISALDQLFTQTKTENMKVEVAQLVAGGAVPQMAQVHALDSEARIGSRPDFEKMNFEKLFIKEKLNMGEALRMYVDELGGSSAEQALKGYIFNDSATLIRRVLTRAAVMNGELLSNATVTVNENNIDTTIDFGMSVDNKINLTAWGTVSTDVIAQLRAVQSNAKSKGTRIARAITSSKQLERLMKNTAIATYMANSSLAPTISNLTTWLSGVFEMDFVAVDDVYTTDVKGGTIARFFDEDVITFLPSTGTIGSGIWGKTPEEAVLPTMTSGFVTTTSYYTPDPVATWVKASGMYLPVVPDINKIFIGNIVS